MTDIVPTIKIKAATAKGFRIINADKFNPELHERIVDAPPVIAPPPLEPPPAPPSPLDSLPENWKDKASTEDLKRIAAAVSGRAVENRKQAIDVIEQALAAQK